MKGGDNKMNKFFKQKKAKLLVVILTIMLILGIVTHTVAYRVVIQAVLPDIQTEATPRTVTLYVWKE